MVWTVLTIIAAISLVVFFSMGRNAVWGGATAGLIVGVVVALVKDGLSGSIVLKAVVVGTLAGVVAEVVGRFATYMARKKGLTD